MHPSYQFESGRQSKKTYNTFLKVKLKPGISGLNLFSYILITFITFVQIGVLLGFVSFILEDPKYYNRSKTQTGVDMAQIGLWAEVIVLVQDLYIGFVLDVLGRKIPIVIGTLAMGMATAAIPLFHEVWPSFFLLRVVMSLGAIITLNIPLLPDYVQPESMGLANAYVQVAIPLSYILSTTGLYAIVNAVPD